MNFFVHNLYLHIFKKSPQPPSHGSAELMRLPGFSLIPVNLASLRFKVKLGCEEEFETMWR